MRSIALAITIAVAACMAVGCAREVRVPYPVEVVIEKPVRLPEELLRECVVYEQTDKRMGEYVKSAVYNTPALRQCARQIEEIRKLQPEE